LPSSSQLLQGKREKKTKVVVTGRVRKMKLSKVGGLDRGGGEGKKGRARGRNKGQSIPNIDRVKYVTKTARKKCDDC